MDFLKIYKWKFYFLIKKFTCLMLCIQVFSGNTYKEQDLPVRHVFIRAFYTRYVKFHVTRWATTMPTLSLRVEIYGKRIGKNFNGVVINITGVHQFLKKTVYVDLYRAELTEVHYRLFLFCFGISCSHSQFSSPNQRTNCSWLRTPPSALQVSDIR